MPWMTIMCFQAEINATALGISRAWEPFLALNRNRNAIATNVMKPSPGRQQT